MYMCMSLCVDMCLYVFICMHVYVSVCLFHQSSSNCVLPTMHKGRAYISTSLLLPPYSSQYVTLLILLIIMHCYNFNLMQV